MVMTLITLDFETYYSVEYQLSKLTTMEYIRSKQFKIWGVGIKIDNNDSEWYSHDEVEDCLAAINWQEADLVCHNALFDAAILSERFNIIPAYYSDTACMARGLSPNTSAKLAEVAKRLFDDESMRKGDELVKAKGIVDLPPEIEEEIAKYCIQDVDLTYAIYSKLLPGFPQSELNLIDATTRMFCQPSLVLDRERLIQSLNDEIANKEKKIEAAGVERAVLASNPKFAEYLQDELGIVPPTKISLQTNKETFAFGKSDPAFIQMQEMYPQYKSIWDARLTVKSRLKETRASRLLAAARSDRKLNIPLKYYAAHTGRFGGVDRLNLQNMPRGSELRKCIAAPDGHLVYVADYSNIEARMLAWLADEQDLLQQFASGTDVYAAFASTIYNRKINGKTDPTERFVGKTAVLGLGYGMGWRKFQATLSSGSSGPVVELPDSEAMSVVSNYRSKFYKIARLWKVADQMLAWMINEAYYGNTYGPDELLRIEKNSIRLPNEMSLNYTNLRNVNGEYEYERHGKPIKIYGGKLVENIIQALARIVITDALLQINQLNNLNVAFTVHDEIIAVGPKQDPDTTMETITQMMEVRPPWASTLPLAVEGGYADRYSK